MRGEADDGEGEVEGMVGAVEVGERRMSEAGREKEVESPRKREGFGAMKSLREREAGERSAVGEREAERHWEDGVRQWHGAAVAVPFAVTRRGAWLHR